MKTLRLTAIICLLLGAMVSCHKGNNSGPNTNSTDEAADLVTASLSTSTNGAFSGITDITVSAQAKVNLDSICGTTWADSVTRKIPAGAGVSYNYSAKYTYSLNCDTPQNGFFNGSAVTTSVYNASYTGPSLSITSSGSSSFTVAGLGHGSTTYNINGEYKQSGSFQSKRDNSFSGTHSIDINVHGLKLMKPLRIIKSGSATFEITGDMPKRGSFDYTGTVVFNGGYNATLTVNGTVYIINLATGEKRRG